MRTQMAAVYTAHALAIADALGDKPLCVVTGPRRFGKSTSLLPTLAGILRERGKTVHIINGRDYEDESFVIESLPTDRFDVLIIDEANVLTRTKSKMKELLPFLHQRGNAIVPVITFHAGYESGAVYLAKIWQDTESSSGGNLANIVCLPQMIVPPELAKDLLTLYSPIRNEAARAKMINYIVERVPLNPYILLELAGARSIAEIHRIVCNRKGSLFQGALSPDEYRKLEQSLEEDEGASSPATAGDSREPFADGPKRR